MRNVPVNSYGHIGTVSSLASDMFDAQSISDVLNRAKRQADGGGKPDSNTVKPVLSGHSKLDKTKVLKTIGIA